MKKNHELREQLMQMKQTLKDLEALCTKHPAHRLINEVRRLRIEVMKNSITYFIEMLEEKERP